MQLSVQLSFILLAFSASLALAAPQACDTQIGATYHLTNNKQGNNIVVHDILSDGSVKYSRSISTGGVGSSYHSDDGSPGPDAPRGQGSVAVSGQRLFNVNVGSDTISMFTINPRDPTQLQQVGKPVNSGGNFPVSIAVSSKTGNVCTLNAGKNNGVQCFKVTSKGLQKIANSNRPLRLNESTPPSGANSTGGVSTVLFTRDGSKLVVDVKGVPDTNAPGYLAVWDVNSDGSLSQNHQSFPAPTRAGQLNFGMVYLNKKEGFVMADASQGGLVYDFSKGYNSRYQARNIKTPGQMITCWASYASKSDTYFFTDAGAAIISEYSINESTLNTTLVKQYQLPKSVAVLDTAVGTFGSKQYLYQLAAVGSSIFVFDVKSTGNSQLIQSYNFTQGLMKDRVPVNPALVGMAIFEKN